MLVNNIFFLSSIFCNKYRILAKFHLPFAYNYIPTVLLIDCMVFNTFFNIILVIRADAINLGNKNVKIGIFTGGTSVRSKNISPIFLDYPIGKHEMTK